jgi:hypothetical protein
MAVANITLHYTVPTAHVYCIVLCFYCTVLILYAGRGLSFFSGQGRAIGIWGARKYTNRSF